MGDRISIQFIDKYGERSVPLFSHWQGVQFVKMAQDYVNKYKPIISQDGFPMESNMAMVDFIRYITQGVDRVITDIYLGANPDDGDNSDNGNWIINLEDGSSKEDEERCS